MQVICSRLAATIELASSGLKTVSSYAANNKKFDRLKNREGNILNKKIRANDIKPTDAEHFDSFSSVIFNRKLKYCCYNKKISNARLKLKTSIKFISGYRYYHQIFYGNTYCFI